MIKSLPKIKSAFLILFSILLGAFLPTKSALAQFGFALDVISGIVTILPMAFIAAVLLVAGVIATVLAGFGGVLLKWVLSPSFIQWSYTNPANNQLIELGFNITRPLANLLLVVFLVVIALSIALRLGEYGSKKTFVKLLAVALLINFSHVITGLIVDASNIVMNFFIQAITGGSHIVAVLGALWETLASSISFTTFKFTSQTDIVLELILITGLNFILTFVLLAWALVLAIRHVMIWLLVILSPLAFVAWILPGPATQRVWNLWWNAFITWVVIGVNAVFFLYLADQFALLNPTLPQPGTLGGAILPAILPVIVYWAGFIISFAKLPSEIGAIKSVVKWGAIGAGAWVGAKAGKGAWSRAEEKFGVREKAGAVLTGGKLGFSEDSKLWQKLGIAGKGITLKKGLQDIAGLRTFIPEAVKAYPYVRKPAEAARAKMAHLPSPEIVRQLEVRELHGPDRVAALDVIVDRDDTSDYFDHWGRKIFGGEQWQQWREKEGVGYQFKQLMEAQNLGGRQGKLGKRFLEDTQRDLNTSFRAGLHKGIIRGSPRMGAMAAGSKVGGFEDLRSGVDWKQGIERAIKQTRPDNIPHWEREEFMIDENIEWLMERGDQFWRPAMGVKEAPEQSMRTIGRLLKEYVPDFEKFPDTEEGHKDLFKEFENKYKDKHEGKGGFFDWVDSRMAARVGVTREAIKGFARHPGAPPPAGPAPGGPTPGAGPTGPGGEPRLQINLAPRAATGMGPKPKKRRRPRGKP